MPLFEAFAEEIIDAFGDGWKNAKHGSNGETRFAFTPNTSAKMRVDAITTDDVIAVLRPISKRISETADLEEGIWIVPATRMKIGIEHRVPLSKQAIALPKRWAQGTGLRSGHAPVDRKGY